MMLPRPGGSRFHLLTATSMTVVCVAGAIWATTAEPALLVVVGGCAALCSAGWLLVAGSAAQAARSRVESADRQAEADRLRARVTEIGNSQGRFVANIAHEIKTPLTTSLLQLDLLLRDCDDSAMVRARARSCVADLHHLSALVDGFLRLARPFSQADDTHHVAVDVRDVVVTVAQHCQAAALDGGVRVVLNFDDPAGDLDPWTVHGDAALLEAMLENLLRNALRFAPRGSSVEFAARSRDRTISLLVRDHGAGIAADQLENVFDWFFLAPGSRLPSAGTGFGLAVAQRIAEHHGGSIALRNVPAGGCEFEVTLPRQLAEQTPPISAVTRQDLSTNADC